MLVRQFPDQKPDTSGCRKNTVAIHLFFVSPMASVERKKKPAQKKKNKSKDSSVGINRYEMPEDDSESETNEEEQEKTKERLIKREEKKRGEQKQETNPSEDRDQTEEKKPEIENGDFRRSIQLEKILSDFFRKTSGVWIVAKGDEKTEENGACHFGIDSQ